MTAREHYQRELKQQAFLMLGSLEAFGNPVGLLRGVGQVRVHLMNRGAAGLVRISGEGLSRGVEVKAKESVPDLTDRVQENRDDIGTLVRFISFVSAIVGTVMLALRFGCPCLGCKDQVICFAPREDAVVQAFLFFNYFIRTMVFRVGSILFQIGARFFFVLITGRAGLREGARDGLAEECGRAGPGGAHGRHGSRGRLVAQALCRRGRQLCISHYRLA